MIVSHVHKATVLRVHDGDSFFVLAKLDYFVRAEIEVRLHGYSAPELKQPDGEKAYGMLAAKLPEGSTVVINSVFSEHVTPIQEEGTRSFTRWVCDVELVPYFDLNQYMRMYAPSGGIGT
jgi:hypothetical protein